MGSRGGVVLNQENYGTVIFPNVGGCIQVDRQNSAREHFQGFWIYSLFPTAPL